MLIKPHISSRDIQAGQTSGSTLQNINVLRTIGMERFYTKQNGKLRAHPLMSWGTVWATGRELLCQNYFHWSTVKQLSGKHHHNYVNYNLCEVYQNDMDKHYD
jgi:hypothetical protein